MPHATSKDLATLIENGFLSNASEALKELMIELASEQSLTKGEILFAQDDPGETLFAIGSG